MNRKRPFLWGMLTATLVGVVALAGPVAAEKSDTEGGSDKEKTDFAPGREVKVTDPKSGKLGYYLVYVPKNYSPDRTWPVIFNYHGLNGKPSTWPFKRILSGSHYIIVGMGYYMRGKPGYRYADTKDVEILKRVGAHLAKHLKINKKQLFAGGFSKGGCYVHEMMIAAPRFWTGGIMLGGGSGGNRAKNSKDTAAISRKLIFIGCGGKDVHLKYADTAREYYTSLKASVTYEKWLGVGHTIDWKATKLSGWLMADGCGSVEGCCGEVGGSGQVGSRRRSRQSVQDLP